MKSDGLARRIPITTMKELPKADTQVKMETSLTRRRWRCIEQKYIEKNEKTLHELSCLGHLEAKGSAVYQRPHGTEM